MVEDWILSILNLWNRLIDWRGLVDTSLIIPPPYLHDKPMISTPKILPYKNLSPFPFCFVPPQQSSWEYRALLCMSHIDPSVVHIAVQYYQAHNSITIFCFRNRIWVYCSWLCSCWTITSLYWDKKVLFWESYFMFADFLGWFLFWGEHWLIIEFWVIGFCFFIWVFLFRGGYHRF